MPKGHRETFKIELLLDHDQRHRIRLVWDELRDIDLLVRKKLADQLTLLRSLMERGTFIEVITPEVENYAPSVSRESLSRSIGLSYDRFRVRHDRGASHKVRGTLSRELEVNPIEIILSSSEYSLKIPELGLCKYKRNRFINPSPGELGSDNHAWLLGNIRRASVIESGGYFYLFFDCTDKAEEERRRMASEQKAAKKSSSKSIQWLEDVREERKKA
jgi:hypothetical protein